MISINVFQELQILILILGDKELKNLQLGPKVGQANQWVDKNVSLVELGKGDEG